MDDSLLHVKGCSARTYTFRMMQWDPFSGYPFTLWVPTLSWTPFGWEFRLK